VCLTAALSNWRNTCELLDGSGVYEAVALLAKGSQEARRKNLTRTRKVIE
jgi:hypothetical protein